MMEKERWETVVKEIIDLKRKKERKGAKTEYEKLGLRE